MHLVIGLTGPNASGKGEAAAYLSRRGFRVHSLSDVVREEARARGLPPEREHLIRLGNELRARSGAGALAERILSRLEAPAVVDSIRNPEEVRVLRGALAGFVLVGLTAPDEIRFRRSRARARPGDPDTLEGFRAREGEENLADPARQRLDATLEMADEVVDNSSTLEALHRRLDQVVAAGSR